MLKAKDSSVSALTKGIEGLFKKNKVDYIKGEASFTSPTRLSVNLLDGGQTEVEGKNIIIATGSEVTPFPGIEIDEKQIVSSTGALDLQQVPEKMVVIGGGIIGLEMGSVWSRLGSEVTVVEYLPFIGGAGLDEELGYVFHRYDPCLGSVCFFLCSKQFQKVLKKQGLIFKTSTKVLSADKVGGKVQVKVESAKGGNEEMASLWFPFFITAMLMSCFQIDADVLLVAIGRRPVTKNLGLEKIGVEMDNKGRVVIDDQYSTSVQGVKCIGDVTFGPMLAHKAEEEGPFDVFHSLAV